MGRLSRRAFVVGAGAAGLGLLAGCARLPWQGRPPVKAARIGILASGAPEPQFEVLRQGLQDFRLLRPSPDHLGHLQPSHLREGKAQRFGGREVHGEIEALRLLDG